LHLPASGLPVKTEIIRAAITADSKGAVTRPHAHTGWPMGYMRPQRSPRSAQIASRRDEPMGAQRANAPGRSFRQGRSGEQNGFHFAVSAAALAPWRFGNFGKQTLHDLTGGHGIARQAIDSTARATGIGAQRIRGCRWMRCQRKRTRRFPTESRVGHQHRCNGGHGSGETGIGGHVMSSNTSLTTRIVSGVEPVKRLKNSCTAASRRCRRFLH